jgi:hypothetical protein
MTKAPARGAAHQQPHTHSFKIRTLVGAGTGSELKEPQPWPQYQVVARFGQYCPRATRRGTRRNFPRVPAGPRLPRRPKPPPRRGALWCPRWPERRTSGSHGTAAAPTRPGTPARCLTRLRASRARYRCTTPALAAGGCWRSTWTRPAATSTARPASSASCSIASASATWGAGNNRAMSTATASSFLNCPGVRCGTGWWSAWPERVIGVCSPLAGLTAPAPFGLVGVPGPLQLRGR